MSLHPSQHKNHSEAGFTLVEMLVSVFIFSIVVIIVSDVFVSALNSQKAAYRVQQVEENVNYIVERMTKEIRVSELTGVEPADSGVCPSNPATKITLRHPDNGTIEYFLSDMQAHRKLNGVDDTVLNSNTVEITGFNFCVSGGGAADATQPRITIVAGIRSKGTQVEDRIQTTVSLRKIQE